MKKLGSTQLERVVENDVNRIIQCARIVISLTPEGPMVFLNPKPALNILGVIGPGTGAQATEAAGRFFPKVVLLEVGLGVGRPYHETKNYQELNDNGNPTAILQRRKWFYPTVEQYEQAAPWIFSTLQDLANEQVASRKANHKNPYWITTNHPHLYRGRKAVLGKSSSKSWPGGTRFAVSLEDRFLISDIYWLEKHNETIREYLMKLARRIDLRLNFDYTFYLKKKDRPKTVRKEISRTERFQEVIGMLKEMAEKRGWDKKRERKENREEKLPSRYIVDLLDYLPRRNGESRSKYYYAIAEALGYTGEELREEKFVRAVLPNPRSRLSVASGKDPSKTEIPIIRITSGLSHRDHIVFEITSNLSDLNEELGVTSAAPAP